MSAEVDQHASKKSCNHNIDMCGLFVCLFVVHAICVEILTIVEFGFISFHDFICVLIGFPIRRDHLMTSTDSTSIFGF